MNYRVLFTAINLVFHVAVYSQIKADSLSKYSYFIYGVYNNGTPNTINTVQGTCFFIKVKNKTFIISAKHLLTSWSPGDSIKRERYPDTLYIRFINAKNKRYTFFPIDISKTKKTITGSYYFQEADVDLFEFKEAAKFKIYSIENLIKPLKKSIDKIIIYGFPELEDDNLSNFSLREVSNIEASIQSSPDENINYDFKHKKVYDSINYVIKPKGEIKRGYSGAPIFLKEQNSNKWIFGGLATQGVSKDNIIFVVKPKIVQSKIAEKIKKLN